MQLDSKFDWLRQESRKTRFSTVTLSQYEEYFAYLKETRQFIRGEYARISNIIDGRKNKLK